MYPERNLLSQETSPYLRQHADNLVHWRPWGEDALQEAEDTGKPILLSIGYAACHWCHVMAHESFEDAEIAALMNRLYVNIKVDREERPDIDQIFMAALAAMGEQGGWPLTMFLTPDGRPFWGGTYFPPQPRYGRPGFAQVLQAVEQTWRERSSELNVSARKLSTHLEQTLSPTTRPARLTIEPFRELTANILGMIDETAGGLKGAPKFPNAPFLTALWLRWLSEADDKARAAVLLSLRKMLCGGIYDHVGGGLARYSTDANWIVPHFEKMLYDNAQLIRLCNWAYGETGDSFFARRVEETIGWLLREMRLPSGAFASSLDADSEGGEGAFYTWQREQLDEVLGREAAENFLCDYDLAAPQGWEGDPILVRRHADRLRDGERIWLEKLRAAREQRPRPGQDDKVLADWNGLAIAALAEAARTFGRADWAQAAEAAYRSVTESIEGNRLPHIVGGAKAVGGLSSDYAAMIFASTALYQASWDETYLRNARNLRETLFKWHGDDDGSGFYLTASDAADVPMRIRGDTDEAVPSATAQIIEALGCLALLTGDTDDHDLVMRCAEAALGRALAQRYGQVGIVMATALILNPLKLVISDEGPDGGLVSVANCFPDPRRMDRLTRNPNEAAKLLPLETPSSDERPTAYLCRGPICLPPISDAAELETILRRPDRSIA